MFWGGFYMDFTGERYLPERRGDIALEHRHRYLLACTYANGKDVLDIACGEGYGSSMLADVAKSVIGVDIAEEAIAHASTQYAASNLAFRQGNAAEIPLEDASVDLVVSFETIEHHDRHEDMLREIKRVLRPGGLLLISSPDKHEYTDVSGEQNEFHVHELYRNEFETLLSSHFAHHKLSGQRVTYASVLASADPNESFISWEDDAATADSGLSRPLYFIALASDGPLPPLPHSVLKMPVDESDCARQLKELVDKQQEDLLEHDRCIFTLREQKEALQEDAAALYKKNVALQDDVQALQGTVQELCKQAEIAQKQMVAVRTELARVYSSRSWRLTVPLRTVGQKFRALVNPRPHCGMMSLGVMSLALLPSLFVYNGGFIGGIRALRKGKAAFMEVHTNTLPELRRIYGRPLLWNACMVSLVFARRIYRNGGVLPALYLTWKAFREEGRQGLLVETENIVPVEGRNSKLADVLACIQDTRTVASAVSATVVVPVYNGLNHLEKLCPALFTHSMAGTRYIFVDDASPDPQVYAFLQEHVASRPDCLLLRNETNLGFVKTVNVAVRHVSTPCFVLLNTDVVVPEGWLERLTAPLAQNSHIASVTPFSNSAVYFSYPLEGQDNAIPEGTTPEELDNAFARLSPVIGERCTVHSGVGFCMAVSKACWDIIGPLDDVAFDRGYGEECDWCMRATSRGWRNVLVPNLFVYHAHGGSFASEEKQRLMVEHGKILQRRWPEQMATVRTHEEQDPWECYRAAASLLLANAADAGKKTVLLVDVALTSGGACAYREKTIKGMQSEGHRVLLLQFSLEGNWMLTPRYLNSQSVIHLESLVQLQKLFTMLRIDEIFVNNLAYCQDTEQILEILIALKKQQSPDLTYLFHDFFSVCPSFFLLDPSCRYCAGGSPEACAACCAGGNLNFVIRRTDIGKWRAAWKAFLTLCDHFRFFSQSTLDIASTIHDVRDRAEIIEHELLAPFSTTYAMPAKDAPLVIGFLGPFVEQKGAPFIRDMGKLLEEKDPSALIRVFGANYEGVYEQGNLRFEGTYQREDIPTMLTEKGVKIVVLPSPSPETFSYIAQECMTLNVPLVCFDIGAPAERIRKYGYKYGALAPEFSAESLLATVENLLDRIYAEKEAEQIYSDCAK